MYTITCSTCVILNNFTSLHFSNQYILYTWDICVSILIFPKRMGIENSIANVIQSLARAWHWVESKWSFRVNPRLLVSSSTAYHEQSYMCVVCSGDILTWITHIWRWKYSVLKDLFQKRINEVILHMRLLATFFSIKFRTKKTQYNLVFTTTGRLLSRLVVFLARLPCLLS